MIFCTMADLMLRETVDLNLLHRLRCESRCFGDKGDVEDITEGLG